MTSPDDLGPNACHSCGRPDVIQPDGSVPPHNVLGLSSLCDAPASIYPAALPPVWLLDVDGVVNAHKPGWGGPPRKRGCWSASDAYEYTMRWAPPLVDRIRALHKAGVVEVRWCTTWCPDAEALERLWSLPTFVRAFTEHVKGEEASVLKVAAARQVLASGRRLVWTDDVEVPLWGELHDELIASGRALLIRPKASTGLQPEHMDRIEAFARDEAPRFNPLGEDAA